MKQVQQLARLAIVVAGVASSAAATAQMRPFYVGASQAFMHDSNLFRQSDGAVLPVGAVSRSDTISTTSLLAGMDLPISRQRVFGEAAARHSKFRDNDQLDHTGFGLNVGVDWETINRLSGTVSYTVNETLASFADTVIIPTEPNKERSQQFLARGKLGGTGLLALEATFVSRKRDYSSSAAAAQANEFDQNTLGLGVLYKPSSLLELGTALRHTRGSFSFLNDDFDRNDLDLTAVWTPTGLSKLAARLSFSEEEHDVVTGRDFSGVTGGLSWIYKPTGKLTFTTDVLRETGAEASFNGFGFNSDASAAGNNSEVASIAQIRANYEATAKVSFDARARYQERDLLFNAGTDKTGALSAGVNYLPLRGLLLQAVFGYEKRGGSGSVPFTARTAMLLAQFKLQ